MSDQQMSIAEQAKKERASYESWEPELKGKEDVRVALEIGLDYRGDVAVTLKDSKKLSGYIFNCESSKPDPYFDFFAKGEDDSQQVFYREVAYLKFSSIDPAAGRSWESWLDKVEKKKDAAEKGVDMGNIEPSLMPMDD